MEEKGEEEDVAGGLGDEGGIECINTFFCRW